MKSIHHTTLTKNKCSQCNKPFEFYWYDAEELNGFSEQRYGFNEICYECATLNHGCPPRSLQQLNDERKTKRS